MIYYLERNQELNCTLDQAWEFFSTPRNLERLTPKSIGFKITHCKSKKIHVGQTIGYKIKVAPFIWVTWLTEITHVDALKSFVDDQRVGPYKIWHHEHHFKSVEGGVLMTDILHYDVGLGIFGWVASKLFVDAKVKQIFEYRKEILGKYEFK